MKTHPKSWLALTVLAFATLMVIVLITGVARAAGPWYVAPGGSDGNSCLSAGSPCATINGAIGKASSGDTIYVATGTYTNSTGSEVVLIDKDTTLSGGWDPAFGTQSGMSTIDGSGSRRGITTMSGVTATIERFVIQDGLAETSQYGGGIYNAIDATLNVMNSTIRGNTTNQYFGGGIYNGGTLTVTNSTVSGNTSQDAGGGIFNDGFGGTLTLTDSIVSDNTAFAGGGIYNGDSGILTLTNSTVSGNNTSQDDGGGIYNNGTATLTNSTVSGNTAPYGGGIYSVGYSHGTLILANSTVSGNTASGGGGLYNGVYGIMILNSSTISGNTTSGSGGGLDGGGGIFNIGVVTLNNSTVSSNTSQDSYGGGGIINFSGYMNLNNTTVSDNTSQADGGGIQNDSLGTVTLQNSILAGNTAAGAGPDCNGTIDSSGYNLIGNTTNCTIGGDTTGNMTGVDPLLGPLQDNGGPTLTHALLSGSPAIDAGNPATPGSGGNACETTDQRGIARPQGATCDIGAFELEQTEAQFSSSNFSVNENAGTAVITVTLSEASLMQTVMVDYTTSDGTATAGSDYVPITGTLTFPPGVMTQTFSVTITDDALDEADETVTLTLSNFVNAVPGVPYSATLTIVDNEFKVYLPLILK